MTYTLIIGDRAYSSWSLRGWLMFEVFGLPYTLERLRLYTPEFSSGLAVTPPARTVPVLRCADGTVVADTIAIAEELVTRHPEISFWPAQPSLRATARMLSAEMHSSFAALRETCPMNLRVSYAEFPVPDAVKQDLARIEDLWAYARNMSDQPGPWLFGEYSLADVFYAPVAARIATYNLSVGPEATAYVDAHLSHTAFRRWRAMALVDGPDQPDYFRDHPNRPWPGLAPRAATAVSGTEAINSACPFSGAPVTDVMEVAGRRIGFCNAFCRDKAAADPDAWPQLADLLPAAS